MAPDPAALHAQLVEELKSAGVLARPEVEAAFRAVPRHPFLPGVPLTEIYRDQAIPTKFDGGLPISSSSQPAMMAIMLEQLGVAPGMRVLEIGAGTGYNAALLAHLCGPSGQVVTVDLDADLVEAARHHLAEAGWPQVEVICADGGLGYAPAAPFDRIILTVGAWDIAPAWHEQLGPRGRLVLPLTIGAGGLQKSIAFEKASGAGGAHLASLSLRDCGFMRLRGSVAGPERTFALGPQSGLRIMLCGELPAPAEEVLSWLETGGTDQGTGLTLCRRDIWQGLGLWLSLREPGYCDLASPAEAPARAGLPCLFEFKHGQPQCFDLGLVAADGLCLLSLPAEPDDQPAPAELNLRLYGPGGRKLAAGVVQAVADWIAADRPGTPGMRVRAYPLTEPYAAGPGETIVAKRWNRLVVDWPAAPQA